MYVLPEIQYIYDKYGNKEWDIGELLAASEKFNKGEIHNPLWYVNRNYIVYVKCGVHKRCRLSDYSIRRVKAERLLQDPAYVAKLYEEYNSSYKVAIEIGISPQAVRNIYKRYKETLSDTNSPDKGNTDME